MIIAISMPDRSTSFQSYSNGNDENTQCCLREGRVLYRPSKLALALEELTSDLPAIRRCDSSRARGGDGKGVVWICLPVDNTIGRNIDILVFNNLARL